MGKGGNSVSSLPQTKVRGNNRAPGKIGGFLGETKATAKQYLRHLSEVRRRWGGARREHREGKTTGLIKRREGKGGTDNVLDRRLGWSKEEWRRPDNGGERACEKSLGWEEFSRPKKDRGDRTGMNLTSKGWEEKREEYRRSPEGARFSSDVGDQIRYFNGMGGQPLRGSKRPLCGGG